MASSCHIGAIDRNRYRIWATKTTLYARGVNKSCNMITFSHLNSSNFNNFMQEKVKSVLVVLILLFASFLFFYHLHVWQCSQIAFR